MYTDNDTGTTINVYMLYKNVHFNYYQGGAVPGVRSEGADDGQEEQTDEGEEGADDGQERSTMDLLGYSRKSGGTARPLE